MWRPIHHALCGKLSGDRAIAQAREQNRIERYFTFPNFERSADRCGEELERVGLTDVEVESFPADGRTSWSGWQAMKAWDVESARLWLTAPREELLSDWSVNPHSLVMYSGPFGVEGELAEWDGELDVDLTGRIPFTRHRINDVFAQMQQLGATGIVSDFIGTLPGVRDRFDLPDDTRWENSALRPGQGANWGFMLTPRQGQMLRDLMRQGPVRLRVEIQSRCYDGIFKSATGIIPGEELADEEVLFVTHLYEPGGNDNASGVGLGLEIARCLHEATESGAISRPRRSIRFLFNWEGYGLYAWMHKHLDRVPKILGGLNIDEVGVDQVKGKSVLHLFMPPAANPSCVGDLLAHLCDEILTPQVRWKAVADRAEIINDTITSDPNLDVVLPCLIQYPSHNYHSSADTVDTLSAEVMEAVGLLSATHLHFLARAGPPEMQYLSSIVADACRSHLQRAELRLLAGSWPFSAARTERWFTEQFRMKTDSLRCFRAEPADVDARKTELKSLTRDWCAANQSRFPAAQLRRADKAALDRAASLVLHRTTPGTPKAWSLALSPAREQEYRRVLYDNNLDLLFHRIFYWADGKRSVLDIVEHMEFEMDELLRDTSISRTSSGSTIAEPGSAEMDVEALLYVVDLIIEAGYLRA